MPGRGVRGRERDDMSETIIIEPRAAAVETEVDDMGRLRVVPDQIVRLGVGGGLRSFAANAYYLDVIAALGAQVVGYWPLWDAAGPAAVDISGNGRNGAYNGTYTLGASGIGDGKTAAQFSTGVTSGVNVYSAALAATNVLDEGWLSCWVKMTAARWADASTYYLASLLDSGVTNGINVRKISGGLSAYRRVGGTLPVVSGSDYPTTERWQHVIFRWSLAGNSVALYVNGTPKRPVTTAQPSGMGTLASSAAIFGSLTTSNTAQSMPGSMAHCIIGSGTLTSAQARVLARQSGQVVFDGDSRSNLKVWPGAAAEAAYPNGDYAFGGRGLASWAVSGKTLAQMVSTAAADIDPLLNPSGANTIVIWGGVNDNATSTAQQIYDNLAAYCAARKTAGWQRVIVCTEIDAVSAGWTAKKNTLNGLIAANHSWADAVADLGADVRLQDNSNLTYYDADRLHLTAAGYAVVAGIVGAVLAA